jgi:hypothetical protein
LCFDISEEAAGIDRPVGHPWGIDTVMTQGGDKGSGVPVAEGDLADQVAGAPAPSPQGSHTGFDPRLIKEDKAFRIDTGSVFHPSRTPAGNVGAILFAGNRRLFYYVSFCPCTTFHTTE